MISHPLLYQESAWQPFLSSHLRFWKNAGGRVGVISTYPNLSCFFLSFSILSFFSLHTQVLLERFFSTGMALGIIQQVFLPPGLSFVSLPYSTLSYCRYLRPKKAPYSSNTPFFLPQS